MNANANANANANIVEEKDVVVEEKKKEEVGDMVVAKVKAKVSAMFMFVYNACFWYILWIIAHYAVAHLYVHQCAPQSFMGFIMSPLLNSSPQCKALRFAMQYGGNLLDHMWIVLGTWICTKIMPKLF